MSHKDKKYQQAKLSPVFLSLAGTLSIDPDDLEMEEVTRIFNEAIKAHDYFYDMSDDLSVYDKGQAEFNIILEHTSRDKDLHAIWVAFCQEKDLKYKTGKK
jgi:hypothetical protein